MQVTIPGGVRNWTSILPTPFDEDPMVVVIMAVRGTGTSIGTTRDGRRVHLIDHLNGSRGLHVIGHEGAYMEHREIIEEEAGVPMADPAYIGRLSELPSYVTQSDLVPLIFDRDHLGRPYLNLKSWLYNHSAERDVAIN